MLVLFAAMIGHPELMASTSGRPKPSKRLGKIRAAA
jgi:hypothetical protein